jgi:hypothetical protein
MTGFAENRVTYLSATAMGALAGAAYGYTDSGFSSWGRLITFGAVGAIGGAGAAYGGLHSRKLAQESGKPNLSPILGALGLVAGAYWKRNESTNQLIRGAAIGTITAGALGWAITYAMKQV